MSKEEIAAILAETQRLREKLAAEVAKVKEAFGYA